MFDSELKKAEFLKSKYCVEYVARPLIKVTKTILLAGENGREIIKVETERVLKNHKNTFRKLSEM